MEWFVSAWNTETGSSSIRTGEAPDRDSAIAEAIRVGRSITHADDGSAVGARRNFRFGGGDVVSLADVHAGGTEERVRRELDYAAQLANRGTPTVGAQYATPSGSVVEQWNRIATWLRSSMPDVTITPASADVIDAANRETAVIWHDELRSFYGLINGFPQDNWVSLLPGHELFDLDRLIEERRIELEVWGEMDAEMGVTPDRGSPAGTPLGTFVPEFIPFAGMDGYLLFVDNRRGPLYGCVTAFDKVDADQGGPLWISLSALLSDLADSLENGTPFDSRTPSVIAGKLVWS
nr:hypothetical protein [Rhodococcus sp. (in: high G+C Gram-positive bacteria)]